MQYCGFKIFDKMQNLYEIRLNKIIRDLGETDHSIGYIFDVHGCANHKYAIRAATSFLYLAYVGLKNPARSGIVKECAVREYPKSWIGRYQAA